MKKIYLSAAVLFAFGTAFAQVSSMNNTTVHSKPTSFNKEKLGHLKIRSIKKVGTKDSKAIVVGTLKTQSLTPTDTLGYTQTGNAAATYFNPSGYAVYGNEGGGYIFGTNNFSQTSTPSPGGTEIAQGYLVTTPYTVLGALVWFGDKQFAGTDVTNQSGYMVFKEYTLVANGAITGVNATTGATTSQGNGPGAEIGSTDTLKLANADTSSMETLTPITFHSPVYVTSDFAISVVLSNLYTVGDTVAIVDDNAGDAAGSAISNYAFINVPSFGTTGGAYWFSVNGLYGGQLDASAIIYAVVAQSTAGINDNYFVNGLKLGECAPNPAVGNTSIQYELQSDAKNVSFKIFDVTGRLVKDVNESAQTSGKHNARIDVSSLSSGTYYYSLVADSHNLTKKMVVVK